MMLNIIDKQFILIKTAMMFMVLNIVLAGCNSIKSSHDNLLVKPANMIKNMDELTLERAIEQLVIKLAERPDLNARKLMREPTLANEAIAICQTAKNIGYMSEQLLSLEIKILDYLAGNLRDFDKAKQFIADIEAMLAKGLKVKKADFALFKTNKAFFAAIYHTDYQKANLLMEEALNLLNQTEKFNEEKLRITANLAQFAILKGDDQRANIFIFKSQALLKNSKSPVYKVLFLYAYSIYLSNKEEFTKSLATINAAAKYLPMIKDYPTFEFYIMRQKSNILLKLKKYEQAAAIIDECQKKVTKFFQNRPNTISAANLVLKALIKAEDQQDYQSSEKLILEAIELSKKFFRGVKKHSVQALEHLALGRVLEYQKRYNEAITQYLLSENIFRNFMLYLNIDDVSLLYYHLALVNIKINNLEQAQFYFIKHLELFGAQHHRSIAIENVINRTN